ncbi:MAG: SDR family oxidoreductase [Litorimonas sp.]
MGRLTGKSAVILGASSEKGIGEAIARIFVSEGANVTVSGRNKSALSALAKDIGGSACVCDIVQESQIEGLFAHAADRFGSVDIAVNAAGINMPGAIEGLTRETLQTLCDIQFIGPALFIKQAAAAIDKSPSKSGGSIMSLSSITAELTGAGLGAYAGTKAAIDKLVKVAAVEYGPKNIRVNSISPGITPTPMTEKIFDTPSMVSAFEKETPIGRLATPEDVAFAALYLADDRCITTGDNIRVSGGIHLRRLPTYPEMMGS